MGNLVPKDFFISYTGRDRTWAEWIAWTLEEAGYSVIIQVWDFRPGGNFVLDMQRAAAQAERTIAVLSENYLVSQFTQPEWAAAFAQDPTGQKRSLIPVRVGEVTLTGMWTTIVYVDLVGVPEEAARALVLQSVQDGRTKPDQKPTFPGQGEPTTARLKPAYPPNLIQNLPYASTNFVGREAELEQIHQQLQQQQAVAISAISGMGGIGKTELALQYARKHSLEGSYPGGLCWVRAREDVGTQILSFVRSYLELTPPDDLERLEKVRWCWRHWREGGALLIIDDVQRYEDVAPFLPPQDSSFKVLITTRSHFRSPVQSVQLDVLSQEQALELLQVLVKGNRIASEGDRVKQLCEWLGYLPLGVELVGRYLARKPDLSIEELWRRLQEKRLDAIALKQAESGMTASLGVTAAFELSWQALDESAQQLAAVLSLFALVDIPWRMVERCLPEVDEEELEELRDQQFLGAHLLKRLDQGIYQLHQLLKEFFSAKREQRADAEQLHQRFHDVMLIEAQRVYEEPKQSFIKEAAVVTAHLQAAVDFAVSANDESNAPLGSVWLAYLYISQRRYNEAEPLLTYALQLWEQQLGADHGHVATVLCYLAEVYARQGQYTEAEPLYTRALAIREQQLGANHPNVAIILLDLAELYRAQGRYREAEQLYTRALSIREQQLGNNIPDFNVTLLALVELYRAEGRYSEAAQLSTRAGALQEQELETNNPFLASRFYNLASLYRFQGQYSEAESLYRRVLEIYKHHYGENHIYVADCLNPLAALYQAQERYTEAEALFLQALTIREQELGASHTTVAISLNNLGGLYDSQERYAEAELLYVKALTIREDQLGSNHPLVADSLNILAEVYRKQRRYAEAEPLYERALTIREQELGFDHIEVANTLNDTAELYKSLERFEQAKLFFQRALSILQNKLPAQHPSTAVVESNLAHLYDLLGYYPESEALHLQTLPILSSQLDENHPSRKKAFQRFRSLLKNTIEKHRIDELSDNSMTRTFLQQIQSNEQL